MFTENDIRQVKNTCHTKNPKDFSYFKSKLRGVGRELSQYLHFQPYLQEKPNFSRSPNKENYMNLEGWGGIKSNFLKSKKCKKLRPTLLQTWGNLRNCTPPKSGKRKELGGSSSCEVKHLVLQRDVMQWCTIAHGMGDLSDTSAQNKHSWFSKGAAKTPIFK